MKISLTLSAKTVPITSTRSHTDVVRVRPSSTSGVPVDTGPLRELVVTRGAEEIKEIYTEGAQPSASAEAPGLTRANLRRLEGKDPVAAALASVVSSMPRPKLLLPQEFSRDRSGKCQRQGVEKSVKERKGEGGAFGNDVWSYVGRGDVRDTSRRNGLVVVGPIIWRTYASRETEGALLLEDWPQSEGSGTRTTSVDRGLPPRMAAPKLGLDETMELLSRILRAGDEDPDLSALSAALKTKLGLSDLKKPPPTMSPGVELLTRDVKSCRGIRSSPMDTCPSPFHPRVRTVPVCSVGDTTEAEMKGYGLSALAPLATLHPSPLSGGTGDTGVRGRGTKAIAAANLQIELPEFDPKNLPEWAEEFSEFLLLTGQQHADVRTKCTLIKKSCKKKFLLLSGRAPTGATS